MFHKKHKKHCNCCKMHPPMRKSFHSSLAQMCGGVKHVKMPEPLLLYTTGASICLASTKQMCWLSTHLLTISSGSFSLTVIFASKAPKSSPIWIKSFTCPTCRELPGTRQHPFESPLHHWKASFPCSPNRSHLANTGHEPPT